MAYVPNILKKGYAPAWQPKTADQQHEFQTMDGTEYILYAPSFRQYEAYAKSLKKYKDVFEQIKVDIKDDATIVKSKDGFPYEFDYVEWAALLSATLKKLNKTWGVNDKIWIYNKRYDRTKDYPMYIAITPKITQRNAKRAARKVSAAAALATADDEAEDEAEDIDLGEISQVVYVKTKNGLTYYYHTEEDARNNKYFKIENSDEELVNESGKRINPDGTLMKFIRKSDFDKRQERKRSKRAWAEKAIETRNDVWLDDYDTSREPSEGFITEDETEDDYEDQRDNAIVDNFNYHDGVPPYPGAVWDDEFRNWVSDPFDMDQIDEEGNYKIPPEDIIVEPEPAPMPASAPAPAPAPAPIQPQESRLELLRKREKARRRAHEMSLAKNPNPVVAMPPPAPMPAPAPTPAPPTEDPRIVEARIGLPPGWQPLISRSTGRIYYYHPKKGNQYERPTMGGKRTRRRSRSGPRPKSRTKQPKRKGAMTRRKRTTRRRK